MTAARRKTIGIRDPDVQTAPATIGQSGIWLASHQDTTGCLYNQTAAFHLSGAMEDQWLIAATRAIFSRQASLRTAFIERDGAIFQQVHAIVEPDITTTDLAGRRTSEEQLPALMQAEARRPFDLAIPPLVRVTIYRLSALERVVLFTSHHSVCDGWSDGILAAELKAHYEALAAGLAPALPALPVQYVDHSLRAVADSESSAVENALDYWKQRLDGITTINLSISKPRPALQTYNGAQISVTIPAATVKQAKQVARESRATPFTLLAAAFNTLLARYADLDDVAISFPWANRYDRDTLNLIGHFSNPLILRTTPLRDTPFQDFVRQTGEAVKAALAHSRAPFELLVGNLARGRDRSRSPLAQIFFNLLPPMETDRIGGATLRRLPVATNTAKLDLHLFLLSDGDALQGIFEYNTDLFDTADIQQLADRYVRLLQRALESPTTTLGEIPLDSDADIHRMLVEWNHTQAALPPVQTFLELFGTHVANSGSAIALRSPWGQLTYRELQDRSDAITARLLENGLRSGAPVGICINRSLELVVALLGVLKAGGCYVPLDPSLPADRLNYMLQDSGAQLIIAQPALRELFADSDRAVIEIASGDVPPTRSAAFIQPAIGSNQPAYILYTSGSTGQPKGVAVPHRAVVNFLCTAARILEFTHRDSMLAVTTISFDLSVMELFLPLIQGGIVTVADAGNVGDGTRLAETIRQFQPTHMFATPTTWRLLDKAGWRDSAKRIIGIACGEALPPDLLPFMLGNLATVWNTYGPTEATVFTSAERMLAPTEAVTVGRPMANTLYYILDRDLQPTPLGLTGELCIGGAGLALGYHNRPDLTAEKFIRNPFSGDFGGTIYRTGDLASFTSDGRVIIHGRLDTQVKIRGLRVELGEIEATLLAYPGVKQAAATTRKDNAGEIAIAAYFVADTAPPLAQDLRKHLLKTLPAYMVPQHFASLPEFPVTPSGKTDYKRLPPIDPARAVATTKFIAPRTPMERLVAEAFGEILGQPAPGVSASFFDLGGNSLAAIRLTSKLGHLLRRDLPLQIIQEAPTVEELARELTIRVDGAQYVTRQDRIAARLRGLSVTESRLMKVWEDVLGRPASGAQQSLAELPADGADMAAFLHAIRLEFSERIGLDASDVVESGTLRLLARKIEQLSNQPSSQLVCLRRDGSRPPMFLIHAAEGHTSVFRWLAAHSTLDRPIYALRAATLWDHGVKAYDRHGSVEQIASAYIRQIRAAYPKGPFIIGGACSGGVVAYEIARQLHTMGQSTDGPMLLMDAYLAHWHPPRTLSRRIRRMVKRLLRRVQDLELQVRKLWAPRVGRHDLMENAYNAILRRYLYETTPALLAEYHARPFDGRLLVLWSTGDKHPDPNWSTLAGGRIELIEFNGAHLSMLEGPGLRTLIPTLERYYGPGTSS